mmetsp:Transcript_19132/g.55127  ORF Transcript_19132/g.55127 Transcript_19132/m.55127 type:complete len:203 (-) Transcript_19132:308-916(-)
MLVKIAQGKAGTCSGCNHRNDSLERQNTDDAIFSRDRSVSRVRLACTSTLLFRIQHVFPEEAICADRFTLSFVGLDSGQELNSHKGGGNFNRSRTNKEEIWVGRGSFMVENMALVVSLINDERCKHISFLRRKLLAIGQWNSLQFLTIQTDLEQGLEISNRLLEVLLTHYQDARVLQRRNVGHDRNVPDDRAFTKMLARAQN